MSRQKIITMPNLLTAAQSMTGQLVRIVGVGSSTMQGTGAGARLTRYPEVLADMLRRKYGATANRHQHYATSADDGGTGGITYTTSATGGNGTKTSEFNGLSHQTIRLENGATANLTATCKAITVLFAQGSGHDPFTITVDGGDPVTITPNTGLASNTQTGSQTVTSLSDSSHTFVLTSGTLTRFCGFITHANNTDRGLIMYNSGIGGATAGTFLADTKIAQRLTALAPHAVIIQLGSNDYSGSVSLSTYESDLTGFVNATRVAVGANTDILLVHQQYRFDVETPVATWPQYGAVMATVAQNTGNRFLDASRFFNKTAATDYPNFVGGDDIHLTDAGHSRMAGAIYSAFV